MTKTYQNLLKAIAGESIARNKYTFFAKIARKEGWEWIARVFEETADNERAHVEEELEKIKEKVEMTNTYDIHPLSKTLENLRNAATGEKYEWGTMYPDFEKIAREEGKIEIADLFKKIGEVEEKHEERYNILADKLASNGLYKNETEIEWKCLNCGYVHKGTSAPEKCPVCQKPQAWYMGLGMVR
ncbi:rubrerythrin family protein [bacterium (Candidatus Gribaldobacteria) CG08_land_8_20_14_0_20_39_15]|uniref:Rubrerythrin family protein n=1 Tax=bacterium (Candidatus Gribaldobacteria) CG08_land_8_20_14_0_20_39_15 TaxID=2014273 RepID=A0A2M6XV20_9BACT|nr:MAG: rubrerythrin family protein [bacterium (Candidatus Gribaldobacteria) CG08_land_8_20_14_0_20_39_15]